MIDYEVNIFNEVYQSVHSMCAGGKCSSVYNPSPTAFPAGALYELSNVTVKKRQSSTPVENYARVMYQLDCYGRTKAECRALYKAADDKMISLGFDKVGGDYLDNYDNINVFRYSATYEADIDNDGVIYRPS